MVDFIMDVHKSLYPDQEVPANLKEKRTVVVEKFKKLQTDTEPILKIFVDPEKLRECETVLVNDFFLVACLEDFIENP